MKLEPRFGGVFSLYIYNYFQEIKKNKNEKKCRNRCIGVT